MNSKRLFFVLVAVMVLLGVGAVGAVVFGDKLLQRKAAELNDIKASSIALQEQQQSLAKAKKDVQKYESLEKIAKSIVPQEKDQARTVREIVKLAAESGLSIGTITFPSSTLGDGAKKATTPAAPAAPAPKPGSSAVTQVEPVVGISGVSQMEVSVQSAGPIRYTRLLTFLTKLEQNRRTAQVTNITVQPDSADRNNVTFNLIFNVYIKQ